MTVFAFPGVATVDEHSDGNYNNNIEGTGAGRINDEQSRREVWQIRKFLIARHKVRACSDYWHRPIEGGKNLP
jgi:hypothetical protein